MHKKIMCILYVMLAGHCETFLYLLPGTCTGNENEGVPATYPDWFRCWIHGAGSLPVAPHLLLL